MLDLLAVPLILLIAVIPTVLYALAFYLADRHEREPVWLVLVAFLWGAIPAVVASLIAELTLGRPLFGPPDSLAQTLYETSLVAPLVEETAKGLAVYAIYRFFRHEFDGVLDGLTYGALVGFGFAMTENFFYFLGAYFEGGAGSLGVTVFLRTVLFGLNHAVYTGLFGVALGMARHSRRENVARLWMVVGFVAAVLVHALHNLGASLSSVNGLGFLLSLGLAGVGLAFVLLANLLAVAQERRWIAQELADEVGVLLSTEEYHALRRGWPRGPDARRFSDADRRRLRALVELAFRKHRLRRLGPQADPGIADQVAELRAALAADREKDGPGRG